MGSGLEINIMSNVLEAMTSLEKYSDTVMIKSTRTAINRALTTGRKEAVKNLRARLNVKSRDMKKRTKLHKARGGRLASLKGDISFSTTPLPMLLFVKGKKTPIKQKGIKVKRRRKLKAEVYRGKKFVMRGAFIQQVRSLQVFRRRHDGGLTKQAAPSVGEFINRKKYRLATQKKMRESFNKNLRYNLRYYQEKERQKLRSSPLKKVS